jgi:hypothetical protein
MHFSSYCLPQHACDCPLRTRMSMKELIQRLSVASVGRDKTCQNSVKHRPRTYQAHLKHYT